MKKAVVFLLVIFFGVVVSFGQLPVKPGYYLVFFTDKNGCGYDTAHAQEFLSERALQRRQKYGIPVTIQDLPVSKAYVDSLKKSGYDVIYTSRWLNAALIHCEDTLKLDSLRFFTFVDTLGIEKYRQPKKKDTSAHKGYDITITEPGSLTPEIDEVYNYGATGMQNRLLNVTVLHSLGYTGKGVVMALLDAGFMKLDTLDAFDSAWAQHRILGWYDFVDMDTTVFNTGAHGMMALSTIIGNTQKFVGSAPDVSVYLFRTEDENSEYPIEEVNWLVAAEKADSLGVDIISSSLGYETFDDSLLNYSYAKMNGNYAISTIAADIAASKGMVVVVSAGNSGDEDWHYINAPVDGDSVLAVGATDYSGKPVRFSSYGPTIDGRIKPDVAAVGSFVIVYSTSNSPTFSFGTSFSAPTVAGAVACLWQAHPDKTNMEVFRAVQMSGNKANNPDDRVGYGVPNFFLAHLILQKYDLKDITPSQKFVIP